MIQSKEIKPNTPVVCSTNDEFAFVDHMEGRDLIKLMKDAKGVHHYIPIAWVTKVDDKVHLDRSLDQVMREWSKSPIGYSPSVGKGDRVRQSNATDESSGVKGKLQPPNRSSAKA
jgi:hypothetical protein